MKAKSPQMTTPSTKQPDQEVVEVTTTSALETKPKTISDGKQKKETEPQPIPNPNDRFVGHVWEQVSKYKAELLAAIKAAAIKHLGTTAWRLMLWLLALGFALVFSSQLIIPDPPPSNRSGSWENSQEEPSEFPANLIVPRWTRDYTTAMRSNVIGSDQGELFIKWKGAPTIRDRLTAWFTGAPLPFERGELVCAETGHLEAILLLFARPGDGGRKRGNRIIVLAISADGEQLWVGLYRKSTAKTVGVRTLEPQRDFIDGWPVQLASGTDFHVSRPSFTELATPTISTSYSTSLSSNAAVQGMAVD